MSEPVSTYPDALSPGSWEKKKGSLPAGSDVPDKLKSLQKKHGAVEWKLFDGEWAAKAKTEAELDEAYALRERIYRSGVMPLKRDANDLANAARAMAKEKAAAKPTLDAAKAIGAAVNDFVDAIDALADVLAKACDKARPALVKADAEAKAKAKAKAKDDDEDEEEDTPVLLTTKMIPLIRELRKGEVRMHAMIGRAGANTAVLIMRKPIAPARRKLLAEAVDAKGGAKFINGEVLLEDKALTFVVQSPAAGLAKRLRQALLDQVELRLMVKVRGDDGVEDKDGENEEPQPGDDKRATAGQAPSLQSMYEQTKREQYPRLAALVREAGADRDLVLNLMGKAGKAEKTADWAAGLEIYDQLTEIVERQRGQDAAATATATATTAAEADGKDGRQADPSAATSGTSAQDLESALGVWRSTRNEVVAKLKAMATQIAATKDPEAAKAIMEVSAVFKQLAGEPRTAQQVKELVTWISQDDVVLDVSELADDISTPLLAALKAVQKALPVSA